MHIWQKCFVSNRELSNSISQHLPSSFHSGATNKWPLHPTHRKRFVRSGSLWYLLSFLSMFKSLYKILLGIHGALLDPFLNFFFASVPTIIFISVSGGFYCWGFFFPLHNVGRAFNIRILNPSISKRKPAEKAFCRYIGRSLILSWAY